jgi:hypothetical protein
MRSGTAAYLERRRQQETAMRQALIQSHHADRCPVRERHDCTCWRAEAIRLVGRPTPSTPKEAPDA